MRNESYGWKRGRNRRDVRRISVGIVEGRVGMMIVMEVGEEDLVNKSLPSSTMEITWPMNGAGYITILSSIVMKFKL